jgi:3'-phosphoadenosine 5'-phosphosulfate sulfotransferase (PAPS reductase)/FAD synthetase
MKVIVAFSGGKDSLSSLIWAIKEFGVKNIMAVFCDTQWEHEITYQHIKEVVAQSGVSFEVLKSKKYDGFVDLAKKKKRFPSTKARFCTEELKSKPMIDFILDQKENLLILQGIRSEESVTRAKMSPTCTYFKHYIKPYGFDKKGKPKYHTYRKKDVADFVKSYSDDVLRPIFDKTGSWVMSYIIQNGYKPNPLYYKGAKRVGCYPCVMCGHDEIRHMSDTDPEYILRLDNAELEVGHTFFPPTYIPNHARDITVTTKKGKIKRIASAKAVVKYVRNKRNGNSMRIFKKEESNRSCMSYYSICE